MLNSTTLRFYPAVHPAPRGLALVADYDRMEAGIRKYLGVQHVQKALPKDPANPDDVGEWAFEETGEVAVVPYRVEYAKECKAGDLIPADEATAKACGVPFKNDNKPASPAPAPTKSEKA